MHHQRSNKSSQWKNKTSKFYVIKFSMDYGIWVVDQIIYLGYSFQMKWLIKVFYFCESIVN